MTFTDLEVAIITTEDRDRESPSTLCDIKLHTRSLWSWSRDISNDLVKVILPEFRTFSPSLSGLSHHDCGHCLTPRLSWRLFGPDVDDLGRPWRNPQPAPAATAPPTQPTSRSAALAGAIDRYSRAIFPLMFFTFNVVYWAIYLTISSRPREPDFVFFDWLRPAFA